MNAYSRHGALIAFAMLAACGRDTTNPPENDPGFRRIMIGKPLASPKAAASGETAELTVRARDRHGDPVADNHSILGVTDLATGMWHFGNFFGGVGTLQLPKGRYAVMSSINTGAPTSATLVYEPSLTLEGPIILDADARFGKKVSIAIDDPSAKMISMNLVPTQPTAVGTAWIPANTYGDELYVVPSAASSGFRLYFHSVWTKDGQRESPYVYNIVSVSEDRIPDDPTYSARRRDLATVHQTFAAQGLPQVGSRTSIFRPHGLVGEAILGGPIVNIRLPSHAVDYVTPGPHTWLMDTYHGIETVPDGQEGFATRAQFPRKETYRQAWNTMPLGPAFVEDQGQTPATREGNTLAFAIPMHTDSQPNHWGVDVVIGAGGTDPYRKGTTTLRRNNEVIAREEWIGALRATIPPERAEYELSATVKRFAPWSHYAIEQSATWRFTSEYVGETPASLPLMAIRYEPKLDPQGRARAGLPFTFETRVERNPGASFGDIRELTLSVSYDEGATWQPAIVVPVGGDKWRVILQHPTDALFVSFRGKAVDSMKNSVEQTILRAYGLSHDLK